MARAIVFSLFFVASLLIIGLLGQTAHAQLKQMSYSLSATEAVSKPFAIGANRVGFTYGTYSASFYVADGTPTGTRAITEVAMTAMPGPLGYVYFGHYSEWNYYNPATEAITNIITFPAGHYSYSGYPVLSSTKKNYALWSIYLSATLRSYNPTTNETKIERQYSYSNYPVFEWIIYKDELVDRYDLKPPNAANTTDAGLPSNLYAAPHLGYIYFGYTRNATTGSSGNELWRTNLKGYKLVADINPGAGSSNPRYFCDVAGVGLFFFANPTKNTTKVTLYWSDGNSKFKRMSRFEINNFLTNKIPIVSVGARAVFIVNNQLWSSDGTAAGTIQLAAVSSNELVSTQSLAFFTATSADHGDELYQTDGTVEGTVRVAAETVPGAGSSTPRGLAATSSGDVLFSASTSTGIEVFKYTPTTA